nr:MAG TPA: hypothetical protein [Caudoviricetes sp.]
MIPTENRILPISLNLSQGLFYGIRGGFSY